MSTLHNPQVIEVGAVWFADLGFRPAVFIPPHRHDQVDPARVIPAPDADDPYSKFDLPVTLDTLAEGKGYGFVVWPDAAPQITAAALSTPGTTPPYTSIPVDVFNPFPPIVVCCRTETPGTAVTPLPEEPAPVGVMADAGSLLLAAIALLYGRRLWRAAGRFGDWFTAERGNGPGQNGWI